VTTPPSQPPSRTLDPVPSDINAPRTGRPAYLLAAVSLFVPILVLILLPDVAVLISLIVANLAVAAALVAIVLGVATIRATARGARPGRLDGIFALLIAAVSLAFNVPTVIAAMQLL